MNPMTTLILLLLIGALILIALLIIRILDPSLLG